LDVKNYFFVNLIKISHNHYIIFQFLLFILLNPHDYIFFKFLNPTPIFLRPYLPNLF